PEVVRRCKRTEMSNSERIWKDGHLQQRRSSAKSSRWQRRYIQLLADCLRVYEDESMKRMRHQIALNTVNIVEHSDVVFELARRHDASNTVSLMFTAEDVKQAAGWLKELYWLRYRAEGGGVFGRSLADADTGGVTDVPRIVSECVSFLSTETCLGTEGLLRKSGQKKAVSALRLAYQRGESPDLTAASAHETATLLRIYLSELPEPVVPYFAYANFLTAGQKISLGDPDTELANLQGLIQILPVENRNLLKLLSCLFHMVQQQSDRNLMDATAIATLFSSSLLSDDNDRLLVNAEMALDPQPRGLAVSTITALIENYERLFGDIEFEQVIRRSVTPPPPPSPSPATLHLPQHQQHSASCVPTLTAGSSASAEIQKALSSITRLYREKAEESYALTRELVSLKSRLAACAHCQRHLLEVASEKADTAPPASAMAVAAQAAPRPQPPSRQSRAARPCMRTVIAELSDRLRGLQSENEALYKMLLAFNGGTGCGGNGAAAGNVSGSDTSR
uniref:Rho-GAP domain-containing protein n=1 Tax=Macrostomum lignano TaxID=282301 RepID=A0A1I8HZU3_9PLAT